MLFGLTAVGALGGGSPAKGGIAVFLGLAITTVGVDLQTGMERMTFGLEALYDGIPFVIVIVGIFAIGETLRNAERLFRGTLEPMAIHGSLWCTAQELRQSAMPICRGGLIGFCVGILPGAGAAIATILSYTTEKKLAKDPTRFGHGAIEGVAAPEAANNASTCGAFVPLLSLGVPGSGATAVLLGAFIMFGIHPGPLLFKENPEIVWGLINSMYIGNVVLLILNIPLVPVFARILYMPASLLVPLILLIATVGTYGLNGSYFDLLLMLTMGVLGYVLRLTGIPFAPLILACVLGRMLEQRFRQSLTISGGDLGILVHSNICVILLLMTAAVLVVPVVMRSAAFRRLHRA